MEKRKKVKSLSRVQLFMTPWTVAYEAPPTMRFSRQEYWSGLPFPSPGDLPNPGIEPWCPALQADALPSESPRKPNEEKPDTKSHVLYDFISIVHLPFMDKFIDTESISVVPRACKERGMGSDCLIHMEFLLG